MSVETPVSFGLWIRQRRRGLDLTQEELARQVGCSVSAIRKIEADERRPSRQVAELLGKALAVRPDDYPVFMKVARADLRVERLGTPVVSPAPGRPASFLPAPATPLVGRQHELATLGQLLRDRHCRLLTLTGPGGIGKSRLALQAATDALADRADLFRDGIFYVPLSSVSSAEFLVPTMANIVGLGFYGRVDHTQQLLGYLRDKKLLLVLDNIEHLLPHETAQGDCLAFLVEALERAPGLKLLVTSRERLSLPGEWVFEVHGLPVPPSDRSEGLDAFSSVALFLQSAQRVAPGFALEECNRSEVVRICQLMDGMPLGIELAAAWVRMLPCDEISEEIEHNLDFLTTSARGVPERHRSLRAAFDHSWQLLAREEQRVMRQLSVFQGGFRRESAQQVTGASLTLLSALVDKSLLRRSSAGRYDLHELIRQYAATHLQGNPEEDEATRNRHSYFYLTLLDRHEAALASGRQKRALDELEIEIHNIRVAWDWAVEKCQLVYLQRAALSLMLFHELRNLFPEGEKLFKKALGGLEGERCEGAHGEAIRNVVLGEMVAKRAWFGYRLGQTEEALALLRKSIALLRQYDAQVSLIQALWAYASASWFAGAFEESCRSASEGLALSRALGLPWYEANLLIYLGVVAQDQGEEAKAYGLLSEGLALSRLTGDPRLICFAASFLGRTLQAAQQPGETRALLNEALQLARETGDRSGIGLVLESLAQMSIASGDLQEARRLLKEGNALYTEIGDLWSTSRTFARLGEFALAQRDVGEAQECFREALETALQAKALANALDALAGLATLALQKDSYRDALELVNSILQHPASSQETKERANWLLVKLETELDPQQIEALQDQVEGKTFETIVLEILKSPETSPI